MSDTPKRTRLALLDIVPRGARGSGHETNVGSGGDVPFVAKVPTTQTVDSLQVQSAAGAVLFSVDKSGGGNYLDGVAGGGLQVAQVTLTAAQIKAMYAAPVSILASPGTGKVILPEAIHVQVKPTATQFTAGGVVTFVYHGGAVNPHDAADSIAAAVINSATGSNNLMAPISAGIQPPAATGIDITNATGAFATGTGTAIVTIWYRVLPLG